MSLIRRVRVLLLALLAGALIPAAALAASVPLAESAPFGTDTADFNEGKTALAMADDGSVVVGRVFPINDGAVDVAVRRPGGSFVRTNLVPTGSKTGKVLVAGGPGGALAALYTGTTFDPLVRIMPAGSTQWSDPVTLPQSTASSRSIAFGPDGRLWIGTVGGSPYLVRVLVVPASGTGAVTTIPMDSAPPNIYPNLELTVGPDGVGHVAFRNELNLSQAASGQPCTITTQIIIGDVPPAALSITPQVLESHTATGTASAPYCNTGAASTGEQIGAFAGPHLVTTSDGTTTVTFILTQLTGTDSNVVQARRRPAGAAWSTTPETVQPATSLGSSLLPAVGIGNQVGQLVGVSNSLILRLRDSSGVWNPVDLELPTGSAVAAGSASGAALFAGKSGLSPYPIKARFRQPDGSLDPVVNFVNGASATSTGAGIDAAGNAALLYVPASAPTEQLKPFDASGPLVGAVSPRIATLNTVVTLATSAVDVWSPPATTPAWAFDDGTTASGTSVTHTFTVLGEHQVTVSSVDALGKTTTRVTTLSVVAPPDVTAPRLASLSISPKKPTTKRAAKLAFTTSEPGTLTVTLVGTSKGVVTGKKCVAPGKASGKKCTRTVQTKTVSVTVGAGAQTLELPKLKAATWTATLSIVDAAGNRGTSTVLFKVKVAKPKKRHGR